MAFHLIYSDSHSLLASDSALIRTADHGALKDAATILAAVSAARAQQENALAAAHAEATAAGRASGETAGRAAFADAIAALVQQVEDDRDRREEEVATLALAALRQMVGTLGEPALMGGIARRAVEAVGATGPVVVVVSPAMAAPVGEALATLPAHVTAELRPDERLADDQCRLTGPDGRIIADLPVQLAAFEQRWEVAHAG